MPDSDDPTPARNLRSGGNDPAPHVDNPERLVHGNAAPAGLAGTAAPPEEFEDATDGSPPRDGTPAAAEDSADRPGDAEDDAEDPRPVDDTYGSIVDKITDTVLTQLRTAVLDAVTPTVETAMATVRADMTTEMKAIGTRIDNLGLDTPSVRTRTDNPQYGAPHPHGGVRGPAGLSYPTPPGSAAPPKPTGVRTVRDVPVVPPPDVSDDGTRPGFAESLPGSPGDPADRVIPVRSKKTFPETESLETRRRIAALSPRRPLTEAYTKAVDFNTYRLRLRSDYYDDDVGNALSYWYKRMSPQVGKPFDGSDPIGVLGFLYRFRNACNAAGVHEGAAMWLFQYFLAGPAESLVSLMITGESMVAQSPTVTLLQTYPEIVQLLLRTYATDTVLSSAAKDVEGFKQKKQTETEFAEQLKRRALLAGNVFSESRLKEIYLDGLLPHLRTNCGNYLVANPSASLLDLAQTALGHGDAFRQSQNPSGLKKTKKTQVEDSDMDDPDDVLMIEGGALRGTKPDGNSQKPKRSPTFCRLCQSLEHDTETCPLVPEEAREKLLEEREANYKKHVESGRYRRRQPKRQGN